MRQRTRYDSLKTHLGPVAAHPKIVSRLDQFFADPSVETWSDVYTIIIGGGLNTFWRCVCAVNPHFPRALGTGVWATFPDEITARRALRYAAELAQGSL